MTFDLASRLSRGSSRVDEVTREGVTYRTRRSSAGMWATIALVTAIAVVLVGTLVWALLTVVDDAAADRRDAAHDRRTFLARIDRLQSSLDATRSENAGLAENQRVLILTLTSRGIAIPQLAFPTSGGSSARPGSGGPTGAQGAQGPAGAPGGTVPPVTAPPSGDGGGGGSGPAPAPAPPTAPCSIPLLGVCLLP